MRSELLVFDNERIDIMAQIKSKMNKRDKRECAREQSLSVVLEPIDVLLSVCKVEDYSQIVTMGGEYFA